MKFAEKVVRYRIPILILSLLLMIPAVFGYTSTRVNFDMLDYLPDTMETVIGQDELLRDFGKGAFSLIVIEDMPDREIAELREKIQDVDHVDSAIWYDSLADLSIPKELLPAKLYDAFNCDHATMMAVFFDSSTSSDVTMEAIRNVRAICTENCYVSGMSALVTDLKELCEKEEPIYVGIAVVLALLAMLILLDSFVAPFLFLLSIGMMILLNLGSNIFLGEVSYITKALSAVLQLAVTMDYSIFLWHSYNEQKKQNGNREEAMAVAIHETVVSVVGSSVTTIAGFIALCFMTFTLGRDLGIVMAKGVLLGVIGSVTVLPALILCFDRILEKSRHRSLIPDMNGFAGKVLKFFPVLLILFAAVIPPAYLGYSKTTEEVYYDMGETLPEDMAYVIAKTKLAEDFQIGATHMILVDAATPEKEVRKMIRSMEAVDGVKYVLGLESVVGPLFPEALLPDSVLQILRSDQWELLMIGSEYKIAGTEVNEQIDALQSILKAHDPNGLLIGEGPCMKDMIETTGHDFRVVNIVSILAIFVIIMLVEKSISLPVILILVIELAIFINLGIPHYLGQELPFIAPICISTIQLGATVDYAILMTTRYKTERIRGNGKKDAVITALTTSIPSVLVSGLGLFVATFGVAVYSRIDIISSMCMLMARGAIISMLCVIFLLPALLYVFDKVIRKTTIGMKTV